MATSVTRSIALGLVIFGVAATALNTALAQTGIEQYESQPEGRLEDTQITGAMVTPAITRLIGVRVGNGVPAFKPGEAADVPSSAQSLMSEKGRLALLLVDGERIVYEGHRSTSSPESLNMGLSMSKTLTGIAVGQAVCDGKIRALSDQAKVYVPELDGLSFGEASIEDLLLMRGGGKQVSGNGQSRTGMFRALLFQKEAMRDQQAESGKGGEAPGKKFNYDNMSTQSLVNVLERVNKQDYLDLLALRVFAPLQFEKAPAFFVDKEGKPISAGGLHATTRDWARIGLLFGGYWTGSGGDCLASYLRQGFTSKDGSGYGYQIWIHKETGDRKIVRMAGALGQHVYFNNFNKKVLVTFANATSRKGIDQLVDSWMFN